MDWSLFLPWMACWSSTCLACMFVGLYIGYWWGRDTETDRETDAREAEASQ